MNEVKTPKKPLIVYYAIAILVVLLINTLLVPMVSRGAREVCRLRHVHPDDRRGQDF